MSLKKSVMVKKPFLLGLYDAASMKRWNDQIRIVELTELDKQAHKMIVAYTLYKSEAAAERDSDWIEIIEGGIFELLQRIVLTDIKPPLFHKIKENKKKYAQLNEWVFQRISAITSPLGKGFCDRFKQHITKSSEGNLRRRILSAAHFYATKWEFDILERANPHGYATNEIREDIKAKQAKYKDLKSMQTLLNTPLKDFVNICGQLRFQIRWNHLYRVPQTSVMGHMLIVAILSYIFSLQINASPRRRINNYLTGLFHDLPEVLTRDIINPVKKSVEGLDEIIKEYEREEMERKIYKLLPQSWVNEMRMLTENEFTELKSPKGAIERDGPLVKAADDLAAFIEVYLSLKNGIKNEHLENAKYSLKDKYKSKTISGINFGEIYADFD